MAAVRCLVALALLVAAPAFASISVVDDTATTVEIARPAKRIVTLAPNAAELAFAAGAGSRVVGVIAGTDYPPAAKALPIVGDVASLDLERIVALAPDLIVTWPWTTPRQADSLRAAGIAVFEANPRTIDGIATDIEKLGRLTATEATADAAAHAFRTRVAQLAHLQRAGAPLRVFYEVSDAPLFTLGGKHLVTQALSLCGGENVFADLSIPAPEVGVEAVLAANPQVIIAGTRDAKRPAWLDAWTRWPALDAVRHHALFTVDANLLHRAGPRFVDGVEQLCRTLANARRAIASKP
ncbi:MAG TPA: cobalamin-binding protein [Casimicrobiaceae bacterium]|nr:cobalamin-binding protein [Casimicrobiaceae bacterium]